jgi:membrane peptidoglycan carboxypeptidase
VIDYPRYNKDGWQRWVPSWKLTSALALAFFGSILAAGTVAYALVQVPDANKASESENNVFYWDDDTPMVSTGEGANRQIIGIEQIPKAMQNAVVSAENKTFYEDSGVDPMGITRAFVNMAKGGETQGGSTITQQYVKNARLGDQSQTFSRKFKELFISIKVGTQMSKPAIMEGYLNTSYFGRGAYGIQAAARTYYGTDAKNLNPSQCALLATLLKGPTYYDPAGTPSLGPAASAETNTKNATERWSWILGEMVKDGKLTPAEGASWKAKGFPMPDAPKPGAQLGGQVGYLVELAKAYFVNNNNEHITADDLSRGGFEIHTTFNKDKVNKLKAAVTKVYNANIDPKKRPDVDTFVQFGGASVEPSTGKIVAIYGGQDYTKHFTNNADTTGAQVGSTFKPFVLAAAMRDGTRDPKLPPEQGSSERTKVSPDKSRYVAKNLLKIKDYNGKIWTNEDGDEWLQKNDGGESLGPISLREAMKDSFNSPFVQLGMDVGIPQVRQAAIDAGLRNDSSLSKSNVPSFSIGISDPSAIRMAGAYGTFAQSGKQRDPYSVKSVQQNGKTVYEHKDTPKPAFPAAVADSVTDVLKTVVKSGTGTAAQLPGREVAGKTGTTDQNKSAWFVGYTPQLSTAIDMYRHDDNEKKADKVEEKGGFGLPMYGTGGQKQIHGASFPAQIWHDYMLEALKGQKAKSFPKPGPWGEAVFGGGASKPKPKPSPTVTESPSSTPSSTPTETPTTPTPPPTPSSTCHKFFGCDGDDQGANQGNQDEGADNQGADQGNQDEGADNEGSSGLPTPPTSGPPGQTADGGNDTGNPFGGPGGH